MKLRETNLNKLSQSIYDVLIVGGGINGAGSEALQVQKSADQELSINRKGDPVLYHHRQGISISAGFYLAWHLALLGDRLIFYKNTPFSD
jgi:hypothetical protein